MKNEPFSSRACPNHLGIELAPLCDTLFAIIEREENYATNFDNRTMPLRAPALAMLCAVAVVGCVSTGTHTKTLTELEAAKKTAAQLQLQLAGLQQNLDQEASRRKAAEQQAAELAKEREALAVRSAS